MKTIFFMSQMQDLLYVTNSKKRAWVSRYVLLTMNLHLAILWPTLHKRYAQHASVFIRFGGWGTWSVECGSLSLASRHAVFNESPPTPPGGYCFPISAAITHESLSPAHYFRHIVTLQLATQYQTPRSTVAVTVITAVAIDWQDKNSKTTNRHHHNAKATIHQHRHHSKVNDVLG